VHGFAPEAAEAFRRGFPVPFEKSSDHTFGRAVRERQIVHVPDVTVDLTGQTALTQILAGRSIVAVPLLRDGQPIGAIGLNGDPPGGHGYSDSQIALLQAFAEQAVIAITSAETYRALHEALEQQTATSEVLQVINASPGDLAPVFDAILEKAHTLCGAAMGSLVLFDGTHFRAAATLGYTEEYDAVVRQAQLPTIRTQALIGGERFAHVLDMQKVESELDHSVVARSRLSSTGIRTALWMPLRKDNNFLGFISAYRREVQAFSEKEIALLENFATQAVIAMENARLIIETREALEQQTATAEVLVPSGRAIVDLGGARTILYVPLVKDQTSIGVLTFYRQEVRGFSAKQIALLENFTAQAVIAMESARLLNEIRQRQEELRITFENMGDGVAMFDETQHLVAWNRKFQDILDVPDDIIARRQTFSEYVRYLAERGEYDPEADPEEHVRRLIKQAGQSRTYERSRPDGRVIEIRHNPVPGGGFVLIYADITERKRNEAEIRAARDEAEEASRTIEAAYRELKTAPGKPDPGRENGVTRPADGRHRARDQEPAQLRQQFLRAVHRTDRRVAGRACPRTAWRDRADGGQRLDGAS